MADSVRAMLHFRGQAPCQNSPVAVTDKRAVIRQKIETALGQCERQGGHSRTRPAGQQQSASLPGDARTMKGREAYSGAQNSKERWKENHLPELRINRKFRRESPHGITVV